MHVAVWRRSERTRKRSTPGIRGFLAPYALDVVSPYLAWFLHDGHSAPFHRQKVRLWFMLASTLTCFLGMWFWLNLPHQEFGAMMVIDPFKFALAFNLTCLGLLVDTVLGLITLYRFRRPSRRPAHGSAAPHYQQQG